MAIRCDNCGKGVGYGHAVSHAKVRLNRKFLPNLQKLKVLKEGIKVRVKFCTSCIKRLKKDGHLGIYRIFKYQARPLEEQKITLPKPQKEEKIFEKETPKPSEAPKTMNLDEIIGKKS